MSNRHVCELKRFWCAILTDVCAHYPTLARECERDLARFEQAVHARGLRLLTIDLPALGKHFHKCLEQRQYVPCNLPLGGRVNRTIVIPKFLRGLYLLIFEPDGRLKEETSDVYAIFLLRQLLLLGKKVDLPCSRDAVDCEVEKFIATDAELPPLNPEWSQDVLRDETLATTPGFLQVADAVSDHLARGKDFMSQGVRTALQACDKIARLLTSLLGPYRYQDWRFNHGPGATAKHPRNSGVYKYTINQEDWDERLDQFYPYEVAFHNATEWADGVAIENSGSGCSSNELMESRLVDVPKDLTKPRLIAAEPVAHMWCQQNLRDYMYTRSSQTLIGRFVNFRSQEQNQQLALAASVDGRLATIDLEAASDRLSPMVAYALFQGNLEVIRALHAVRTTHCNYRLRGERKVVELRKYSTMGSAVTFPVQSLTFLVLALASVLKQKRNVSLDSIRACIGRVSIFGDDIIVPSDCRTLLEEMLTALQFKVNSAKSFSQGLFRESCGVDAYKGQDITPVYYRSPLEENPESLVSYVAVCNNFYRRGMHMVSSLMRENLRKGKLRPTFVKQGSGAFGIETRLLPAIPPSKMRWNRELQRVECRVLCTKSARDVQSPGVIGQLLQYYTEAPDPHVMWASGVAVSNKTTVVLKWIPVEDLGYKPEFLSSREGVMKFTLAG